MASVDDDRSGKELKVPSKRRDELFRKPKWIHVKAVDDFPTDFRVNSRHVIVWHVRCRESSSIFQRLEAHIPVCPDVGRRNSTTLD